MGFISKLIGILLAAAGVVIVYFGVNADPTYSFILWIAGLMVMSIGFGLLTTKQKTAEEDPPPPTVTEIRCDSSECDFKEIRGFEKGDYILKPIDASCPKCNESMTIEGVYVVKEDKEEDKITI